MEAKQPAEIIVIDDDDYDNDDEKDVKHIREAHDHVMDLTARAETRNPLSLLSYSSPSKKLQKVENTEQQQQIQLFLEVTNTKDENNARSHLSLSGFDLERAIASHFERRKGSSSTKATTATLPRKTKEKLQQPAAQGTLKLSSQWESCQLNIQKDGESLFVDPDFPPVLQSLDGRKRISSATRGMAHSEEGKRVKCLCGLPAAARQVQSDGPNYGKFYLCCGQEKPKKWPKQNTDQKKNNHNDHNPVGTREEAAKNNTSQKENNKIRNPYQSSQHIKRKSEETLSQPPQPCRFFQWDPDGSIGAAAGDGYGSTRFAMLTWQHFGMENGCCLYPRKTGVDPSQVQQGAVGNCWFLSALAVVAEKAHLVRQLLPHDDLNESGCYQINLCLDGHWTPIIVDSNLPAVIKDLKDHVSNTLITGLTNVTRTKWKGREGVPYDQGSQRNLVSVPAFCAAPNGTLWPALVEKAYAKAHGSYAQLSGGFIAEGLFDLTGAPFETIIFAGNTLDKEELWARLMSFHEAGFLMGVATSHGGDGLVGGHAYSVLDVVEIPDKVIGEQLKMTDFFGRPNQPKKQKTDHSSTDDDDNIVFAGTKTNVRLVRIRNPWGKREWKGAWSASSEQWTKALRKILGSSTYAKGDGTFFMSLDDMLQRFHHLDVGKTREGWHHRSENGFFRGEADPLLTSNSVFRIASEERTSVYISLVQPKKRSNTGSSYWYIDPCMIILRKRRALQVSEWECEASNIVGVKRISSCEIFLDPNFEYICVPFSCLAASRRREELSRFRLCTYSAAKVTVEAVDDKQIRGVPLNELHRELLKSELKLLYPVSQNGLLTCIHRQGCLYVLAINGSHDHYLSIKFSLNLPTGILSAFGENGGTYDIPPRSQKILAVAVGNGKFSAATSLKFSYISDTVSVTRNGSTHRAPTKGLGERVEVSPNGEFLVASIDQTQVASRGGDTLDTYMWIPQIGT